MKKSYMILTVIAVLLVGILAGTALAASGNPDYPTKAITFISPYGAGSGTDLSGRAICAEVEKILGVPIAMTNKPGAGGSLGNAELAKARKDGYTIGMTSRSTLAIVPHQLDVPYTYKDFDHICTMAAPGFGIVVPADSPFKTVADVLEAARAPGGLGCAASGYPQPVVMQELNAKYNCKLNYVPMVTGPDVVASLLGNHLKVAVITQADATSYVASGQIRLLASVSSLRWPVKPDLPTLIEQGYDVFPCDTYLTISLPAGVDKYKLDILRKAFKEAYETPTVQEVLAKLNYGKSYVAGEDVYAIVEKDYKFFTGKVEVQK